MVKSSRRKGIGRKDLLIGAAITFSICTLPTAFMVFCWSTTKFPPQVFGNNEDHFRGHVIDPIPESVEILDVEFDDIIIHPDVAYFFRFSIDRSGLEKIITKRTLELTNNECFDPIPSPEWWKFPPPDNREIYQYESDSVIISLCYDESSKIAYYAFWTY